MRVLAIDTETTGLDPAKDRILEIGWVLWDVERKAALRMGGGLVAGVTVSPEISELTGILPEDVRDFGVPLSDLLEDALWGALRTAPRSSERISVRCGAEWLLAHNARFDRGFLESEVARMPRAESAILASGMSAPWIDTMTDLPLPKHVKARDLGGLCAAHGFAPLIQHRALMDALSCCRLLSQYPLDRVLHRAQSPEVIVRAEVSFDDKDKAKALRFGWQEAAGRAYPKQWVKAVKQCDLPELEAAAKVAGFPIRVLSQEAKAA